MMYMYPPWQYGAAAQNVPVHLQQQQQHKRYGNQNANYGGYNRQIDCWICGGNHRSDNCDQKHKFNQDQIQPKIKKDCKEIHYREIGDKEDFQNANIV